MGAYWMRLEWDERKNLRNQIKHGISFEIAALVFDDADAISEIERIEGGEERWQTIGSVGGILVLLVGHTRFEEEGEEAMRIITARKATPRERRVYEKEIANH